MQRYSAFLLQLFSPSVMLGHFMIVSDFFFFKVSLLLIGILICFQSFCCQSNECDEQPPVFLLWASVSYILPRLRDSQTLNLDMGQRACAYVILPSIGKHLCIMIVYFYTFNISRRIVLPAFCQIFRLYQSDRLRSGITVQF